MRNLDLTLPTPQQNLACDEALLAWSDDTDAPELLRLWEPTQPFVVLGLSGRVHADVHLPACRERGIPVLRRVSGGGAVLQSPGCLNFTLVLRLDVHGPCASIAGTTAFVLERHRAMLQPLVRDPVTIQGVSDLACGTRKCSGNAQRRARRRVLFHGTFLLGFDAEVMNAVLPLPARQPAYRANRPHAAFLAPLPVGTDQLKEALRRAWHATEPLADVPHQRIEVLVRERYALDAWNFHR